jgi:hypothetical protein
MSLKRADKSKTKNEITLAYMHTKIIILGTRLNTVIVNQGGKKQTLCFSFVP